MSHANLMRLGLEPGAKEVVRPACRKNGSLREPALPGTSTLHVAAATCVGIHTVMQGAVALDFSR